MGLRDGFSCRRMYSGCDSRDSAAVDLGGLAGEVSDASGACADGSRTGSGRVSDAWPDGAQTGGCCWDGIGRTLPAGSACCFFNFGSGALCAKDGGSVLRRARKS